METMPQRIEKKRPGGVTLLAGSSVAKERFHACSIGNLGNTGLRRNQRA